ncbi:MAG: threonine synthase [candidate division Zixibacteria bacterium]|nr:threonine synthase [candidate division Zixibacteria bacterium]
MKATGKEVVGANVKFKLVCVSCSREYDPDTSPFTCPDCGSFKGTFDVIYPYEQIRTGFDGTLSNIRNKSVWEYFLPILPFKNLYSLPPLYVGGVPAFNSPNVSKYFGFENLLFKDEGRNPSASMKDRATAVAIALAQESKMKSIAAASTGNAAASLATMSASVGLKPILFVPKSIPKPKLAQLLIHGAEVIYLDCDYDTAFDLCQSACKKFGMYNRNTAVNPFTGEGKKTVALEIVSDLGEAPDAVICSVGDGCIIGGLYKGFYDLNKLGLIDRLPRLYGVQAEGAAPVARAFSENSVISPAKSVKTIADSISVGHPRDGIKALRAARNTSGEIITVSDEAILNAQGMLASKAGVFSEPAASAAIAGFLKLREAKIIGKEEKIVVLITGHGLKDIDTTMNNIKSAVDITKPDMESIARKIEKYR